MEDKSYVSTEQLMERIRERTLSLSSGRMGLSALDELIRDIRELEERVIIIRYKGMERLQNDIPVIVPTVEAPKESPAPEVPPTPIFTEIPEVVPVVKEPEAPKVSPPSPEEPPVSKQISLIDSIEELNSAEAQKEESPKKSKPKNSEQASLTYAEKMEKRPVESLKKELNLNQRLGLGKVIAPGDDAGFADILHKVDESSNMTEAVEILKTAGGNRWENAPELMEQLTGILERKFQ
jgi:hypothetical protein